MKKVSVILATVCVAISVFVTSCDSKRSVSLKKDVDTASYALGLFYGENIRLSFENLPGEPINADLLVAAFEQALNDKSSSYKMTPDEAKTFLDTYFERAANKDAEKTKEEGEEFLEKNKSAAGVITTESGLQYKVITEGDGPKPTLTDRVKVHYTGTLLDGTEFDSSVSKGEPATFGVSQVIRGWTEGLQIMPVGSKYIFWIPSDLAYGSQSRPGSPIKPNSMLKFEVELLEIVD